MRRLLLEWKREKQTITDAYAWQKDRGESKTGLKKKLVIYGRQRKMLDRFRQCCLGNILGINVLSVALDSEVLSRAGSISIKRRIQRHRNWWDVHTNGGQQVTQRNLVNVPSINKKTAFVSIWRTLICYAWWMILIRKTLSTETSWSLASKKRWRFSVNLKL